MKHIKWLVFFLIINFGALYIGNLLMDNGPRTDWYTNLNLAPWTPTGWVFGAAWTLIMICFSVYLVFLVKKIGLNKIALVFSIQVFLNIIWNYIFFNQHLIALGLITIVLLTIVVFYFFINYRNVLKQKSALILPYMIWLVLATSLNLYIALYN